MANCEHIFLHTAVRHDEVANQAAGAVQGTWGWNARGDVYVARPGRRGGEVGGHIARNIFGSSDPELDEVSVLDGYEVVFTIRTTVRGEQVQLDEARWLFDDISARVAHQVLLTKGMDLLAAAWSPRLDSPSPRRTSVDAEDRDLWAP